MVTPGLRCFFSWGHPAPVCMQLLPSDFPYGTSDKEPACQYRRHERHRLDPWVRKIPWRRKWQPTPVFLPEGSHGQRSLAGCSPRDHKESDKLKWLSMRALFHTDLGIFPGWAGLACCWVQGVHASSAGSQSAHPAVCFWAPLFQQASEAVP